MRERVALIKAGVVANVIDASLDFALTLGYDDARVVPDDVAIGWQVSGGDLVPPAVPAPPPPQPGVIARDDFVQRFSPNEWRAAKGLIAQSPELEQGFDLLTVSATVNLGSATVQGLIGLLGSLDPSTFPSERVAAILAP